MVRMDEFSPTGWFAICGNRTLPVERFSDDGNAMVVSDERTGCLIEANKVSGFQQIIRRNRVVSVVPATTGWRAAGKDDGVAWEEPVEAWLVGDNGVGLPLIKSEGGTEITLADDVGQEGYELLRPGDPSTLQSDQ
jgi:hypothetical protein